MTFCTMATIDADTTNLILAQAAAACLTVHDAVTILHVLPATPNVLSAIFSCGFRQFRPAALVKSGLTMLRRYPHAYIADNMAEVLKAASSLGDLPLLQWCHKRFSDAPTTAHIWLRRGIFDGACDAGHLHIMGWVEEWYPSAALTHPVNAYCTQPPPEGLDIRRTWIVETTQYRVAGNPNGIPVLEWMRAKNVLLVPQVLRAAAAYGNIAAIEWWFAQDWGLSEMELAFNEHSMLRAATLEVQVVVLDWWWEHKAHGKLPSPEGFASIVCTSFHIDSSAVNQWWLYKFRAYKTDQHGFGKASSIEHLFRRCSLNPTEFLADKSDLLFLPARKTDPLQKPGISDPFYNLNFRHPPPLLENIARAVVMCRENGSSLEWIRPLVMEAVVHGRRDALEWGWQNVRKETDFHQLRAVAISIEHGDTVLDWYASKPELAPLLLQNNPLSSLVIAAKNGRLSGLQWWHARFGFDDALICDLVMAAVRYDQLAIAHWMQTSLSLLALSANPESQFKSHIHECLALCASMDMLRWCIQFSGHPLNENTSLNRAIATATCANSVLLLEWWRATLGPDRFFAAAHAALVHASLVRYTPPVTTIEWWIRLHEQAKRKVPLTIYNSNF
ncbi:hypothetical protein BC828DRAFT_383772 [Blastocladiella britannica]|nr:hypothetical protein BC828DRAFT_383772 [Blastocladiella britannica]